MMMTTKPRASGTQRAHTLQMVMQPADVEVLERLLAHLGRTHGVTTKTQVLKMALYQLADREFGPASK